VKHDCQELGTKFRLLRRQEEAGRLRARLGREPTPEEVGEALHSHGPGNSFEGGPPSRPFVAGPGGGLDWGPELR
jgi:hypothetical protein